MEHRWAPLFLVALSALAYQVQGFEWKDHPAVQEIEDAIHESNARFAAGDLNGPDPNAYWMKQFLELMNDDCLIREAVPYEDLLPNIYRLMEYDHKGYLKPIANKEMSPDDLTWPDPHLKPYIISAYMPVQTDEDPEPVIKLEQTFKGQKVYKEVLGPNAKLRRKRDLGEDESPHVPRVVHLRKEHFNKDIPFLDGHNADHEVHEVELDEDTGEELSRKKRALPEDMIAFPQKNTMFYAAVIHVEADADGSPVLPTGVTPNPDCPSD